MDVLQQLICHRPEIAYEVVIAYRITSCQPINQSTRICVCEAPCSSSVKCVRACLLACLLACLALL